MTPGDREGGAATGTGARERLRGEQAEVGWADLRAHARRDALILVGPGLDLVDAAAAVADDDQARVASWIASGQLRKPSQQLLARWEAGPTVAFRALIVQPYVLAQSPEGE